MKHDNLYNYSKMTGIIRIISCLFFVLQPLAGFALENGTACPVDETMLMFVGEDIEALTIASRREESAWQAAAVAQVINRKELREHGFTTLSEALDTKPGFYMAQNPWGSVPYLRGISNSILFLYDTVPMSADSDKSIQQIDYNLSLNAIKRIEIIRGPGSVLWGPDAFAGIVNVVPLSGRDLHGLETGTGYNSKEKAENFYLNLGQGNAIWDGFLSITGRSGRTSDDEVNIVSFWGDGDRPTPVTERYGNDSPGRSSYLESTGTFSYRDKIKISGRISSNHHPYSISDSPNRSWLEQRNTPSYFVKLEANQALDTISSLRFTGFYNKLQPENEIIDRDFKVMEKTTYGELIYDRSFFTGKGLFTGGLSLRRKDIDDATIWQSYMPDFLGPENQYLFPMFSKLNYRDDLVSGFGQYTYQADNTKFWLGIRYDNHDLYEDNLSFNSGIAYYPTSSLIMKLLYGTAYRTPSSHQLFIHEEPKLEKVETLEAELSCNPADNFNFSLVAFTSRIEDHAKEDPYAQLSIGNHQDINGIEAEAGFKFSDQLKLAANMTLLDNRGPKETFHLLNAVYIRPDGSLEYIYEDIKSPYDLGPETIFNMSATWLPVTNISFLADLKYRASHDLINARTGITSTADPVWLLDINAIIGDILSSGVTFSCSITNLFDTAYNIPGPYEMIEGEPFTLKFMLEKKW